MRHLPCHSFSGFFLLLILLSLFLFFAFYSHLITYEYTSLRVARAKAWVATAKVRVAIGKGWVAVARPDKGRSLAVAE
jgi:hypothetical protein